MGGSWFLPIGVVVHGHHIALLDNTVLLRQILLCESLVRYSQSERFFVYFIPVSSSSLNTRERDRGNRRDENCLGGRIEENEVEEHTVLSLESPIFFPIKLFIHCDVLPPSLDWRPGTTRGILYDLCV